MALKFSLFFQINVTNISITVTVNKNAFSWCNRALEEQLKQIGKKLKSESKHLGSEGFVKIKVITMFACTLALLRTIYRAFSLTWPASMQIDWNKRKPLPGLFRTTTSVGWTSFNVSEHQYHWPPWRHVKTFDTMQSPHYLRTLKRPLVHIHAST